MGRHTVLLFLMSSQLSESSGASTLSKSGSVQSGKSLLVLIPDRIDVEEEARLYDEICDVGTLWVLTVAFVI